MLENVSHGSGFCSVSWVWFDFNCYNNLWGFPNCSHSPRWWWMKSNHFRICRINWSCNMCSVTQTRCITKSLFTKCGAGNVPKEDTLDAWQCWLHGLHTQGGITIMGPKRQELGNNSNISRICFQWGTVRARKYITPSNTSPLVGWVIPALL